MKKFVFVLLLLNVSIYGWTQHETPVDTLRRVMEIPERVGVKQFGDYLLDMRLLNALPVSIYKNTRLMPGSSMIKDYNRLFRLDPSVIYGEGYTDAFSRLNYLYGVGSGYNYYDGLYGFDSNADLLQGSSFKLKNGMRVNLYGKYSADGQLLPGMNTMPWQRHDFKGAFELKNANGTFGVKIEVSREAAPYPY